MVLNWLETLLTIENIKVKFFSHLKVGDTSSNGIPKCQGIIATTNFEVFLKQGLGTHAYYVIEIIKQFYEIIVVSITKSAPTRLPINETVTWKGNSQFQNNYQWKCQN